MPLVKGYSGAAISKNIGTEIRAGKKPAQAKAIAMHTARKARGRISEMSPGEKKRGASAATRKARTAARANGVAARTPGGGVLQGRKKTDG